MAYIRDRGREQRACNLSDATYPLTPKLFNLPYQLSTIHTFEKVPRALVSALSPQPVRSQCRTNLSSKGRQIILTRTQEAGDKNDPARHQLKTKSFENRVDIPR